MKELLLGEYGWELGGNVAVGSGYAYIFKSKKDVDVFFAKRICQKNVQIQ